MTSYLKLRAWNQPGCPGCCHLPGLPPVVVILADDLQDVPGVEGDAGLGAGDQVIVHRVILELGPDKDVTRGRGWPVRGNNLGIFKWRRIVLVNIPELSVCNIVLTLKVTLPLASLSSFCRLSIDWLATLIPLISLISSPTWRVAWKYFCQYFAHTQKVNLSASPNRKHNDLKIQERA